MIEEKNIEAIINKAYYKNKTANILFDNNCFDDAVSRAYYSVFHAITAVLFYKGFTFSSHSQTIGAFNKEFIVPGIFPKAYTGMIKDLFKKRQSSDYDVYRKTFDFSVFPIVMVFYFFISEANKQN